MVAATSGWVMPACSRNVRSSLPSCRLENRGSRRRVIVNSALPDRLCYWVSSVRARGHLAICHVALCPGRLAPSVWQGSTLDGSMRRVWLMWTVLTFVTGWRAARPNYPDYAAWEKVASGKCGRAGARAPDLTYPGSGFSPARQ
ncbi:hypothetical protein Acsp05_34800 [Actinokineospora sp. NBRC 105648]|nr:hypothetical protein Acsp05_34800 [Actinokineospora sp. NBRC 105648]